MGRNGRRHCRRRGFSFKLASPQQEEPHHQQQQRRSGLGLGLARGQRHHARRRVETRALLPMAGTSYALAVALQASKAKLPAMLVVSAKGAAPPLALLASAVLAAVASVLVSKGLNEETQDAEQAHTTQASGPSPL